MKLLLATVMAGAATGCNVLEVSTDLAAWGFSQSKTATGCFGFVSGTVMNAADMEDFSDVMNVKDQFCQDTNDCSKFLDALMTKVAEIEKKDSSCKDAIVDGINKIAKGVQPSLTQSDVFEMLKDAKKSVCELNCGAKDAACWTCEGAELIGMVSPDLSFCTDVPFCKKDGTSGCAVDPTKKCSGSNTVKLFKDKIEVVADKCGNIKDLLKNTGECNSECKDAVVQLQAYAKKVITDAKANDGAIAKEMANNAVLCLMEAAGSGDLKDKISDFGDLLPSMNGMTKPTQKQLLDKCKVTDAEIVTAEAQVAASIQTAVAADVAATSGAATFAPHAALALAGAAALLV